MKNYDQMQEIIIQDGKDENIDTSIYEDETIPWKTMEKIKEFLVREDFDKKVIEGKRQYILVEQVTKNINLYNFKMLDTRVKNWFYEIEPMTKREIKWMLLEKTWFYGEDISGASLEDLMDFYSDIEGNGKTFLIKVKDMIERINNKYGKES